MESVGGGFDIEEWERERRNRNTNKELRLHEEVTFLTTLKTMKLIIATLQVYLPLLIKTCLKFLMMMMMIHKNKMIKMTQQTCPLSFFSTSNPYRYQNELTFHLTIYSSDAELTEQNWIV